MANVAIATMTRARSESEAAMLLRSLRRLTAAGFPIFITDDPASIACFTRELRRMREVHVAQGGKTLAGRVKWSIQRAFADRDLVIYTEPDKARFFDQGLMPLIETAKSASEAIVLATRDAASFETFPAGQRCAERAFNELAQEYLGLPADFLYGPFAMKRTAVEQLVAAAGDDLGWGWRIYVLARCILANRKIRACPGYFACPPEQSREDNLTDRGYRLEQLQQNIIGLRRALMDHSESKPLSAASGSSEAALLR